MAAVSFFGGAFFGGEFFNSGTPTPPFGRSGLGGDDVPRHKRISPNATGWNRTEYERQRKEEGKVEATLRAVYSELTGETAAISTLARLDAIVRPAAEKIAADVPLRINWTKIARDYERATALMRLREEERALQAQIEDEDDMILLLQ